MSMRGSSSSYTICEVLREINDLHQNLSEHDNLIRSKLALAERMAKKMSKKLLEYNQEIYSDWWDENPDAAEDSRRRHEKSYLTGEEL